MRVPATLNLFLMPKNFATTNEGRVLIRTGSVPLDRRFNARTDHPMEFKMLTTGAAMKSSLEQLCCSTQTGLSVRDRTIELSELTIPPFTANHVFDHLQSMLTLAKTITNMRGQTASKLIPCRGGAAVGRCVLPWAEGWSVWWPCFSRSLTTAWRARAQTAIRSFRPSGVAPGDASAPAAIARMACSGTR